jgi:carotenoid 1,2-hydratase
VTLEQPLLRWSGSAYFDSNDGDVPLESSFREWTWSRNNLARGTAVYYDVIGRDDYRRSIALEFTPDGRTSVLPAAGRRPLPRSLWGLDRYAHADADAHPRQITRLVDAPFYSRSVLASRTSGEDCHAVHEHLSLNRFVKPWVQLMIPFRMPRRLR